MARVRHPWDTFMKLLISLEPQALVSLLLPGAQFHEMLDKELLVKKIEGDFFFKVLWNGLEIILHLEFQRGQDDEMARRMWAYNSTMDIVMGKPVYSVLIYLVAMPNLVESPYKREIPGQDFGHHFTFRVIKLWEVPPEVLKQTAFESLLPLLPLTQAGKSHETIDDMITELVARNRADLLTLGYNFAGLVLTDEIDKQWLRERFSKVQDIIEGSWVYQETIEKGLEKGREEGREEGRQQALQTVQQTAIRIVAARFPELEQLAKAIIVTISDLNQLQTLIIELSISSGQEHVKHLLLSLVSAA